MARILVPGMRYYVIRRGDRTVAALISRQGWEFHEVVSIVVDRDHRRGRLASSLARSYLAEVSSANRPVVAWVRRSNHASQRFFESLGFRKEKVWSLPYAFEEILPWGDHYVRRPVRSSA